MRFSWFLSVALLLTLFLAGAPGAGADTLVLGSSEFHQVSGPVATYDPFDGGWRIGPNAGQSNLVASVRLPHDATVTSFTMYYVDNSAGIVECNLLRGLITASEHPGSNVLAATGSTENDPGDHFKTDASIDNATIDNTTYYYFIEVVLAIADGERRFQSAVIEYTAPVTAVGDGIAPVMGRAAAHPNPFRSHTAIQFSMPTDGPVTVDIYDLQGRRVRTMQDPFLPAGNHSLSWDGLDDHGRTAPSGVYFAQVKGENRALAARLVRLQ